MVHENWQKIIVLSLNLAFVQLVQHHKWANNLADYLAWDYRADREKKDELQVSYKSPQYSEAKSFTDCLRNLPEKCQQLRLSAVFLFPCLPRRLYCANIDLQCVKGHRIEDDSSRSNHGDSCSLFLYDQAQYQSAGKTLMLSAALLRFFFEGERVMMFSLLLSPHLQCDVHVGQKLSDAQTQPIYIWTTQSMIDLSLVKTTMFVQCC